MKKKDETVTIIAKPTLNTRDEFGNFVPTTEAGLKEYLAFKISDMRRHYKMTITEFADKTGLPEMILLSLERNSTQTLPPLQVMIRIANAFQMPLSVFFTESEATE